jgi:16S rRNA (cytosine1402-N4)-methyltransferase
MPSTLTNARVHTHPNREEGAHVREHRSVMARTTHESVLVSEVLEALQVTPNDVVFDATSGLGGHSEALLNAGAKKVISFDADPAAVAQSRARLSKFKDRSKVVEANFRDAGVLLPGIEKNVNKALFDLGWNMTQLSSGRGFSFLTDDELNMSYGVNPASGFSAKEIVNTWKEKVLADVLYGYGEEQYARRIAKAIVEAREEHPITTSGELAEVIKSSVPPTYRRGKIHPATKSFQALRIATNDEFGSIDKGLRSTLELLPVGGRVAVITFHSSEDRVVKKIFNEWVKQKRAKLLYKKPKVATKEEIKNNPSSRSAKLRAIEKIQETI